MSRLDTAKAVIFDMDGVIFDTERLYTECWIELAKRYKLPDPTEVCHSCIGLTAEATKQVVLDAYGQDFPYDEYTKEISVSFHNRVENGIPMKIGVVELLQFLKSKGIKIALASSTRTEVVKEELSGAGILDYFDEIVGGDQVTRSKPAPDIFLRACERLGVVPEEAYGIEDSFNGIKALYSAKIKAIMVPDLVMPDAEIKRLTEVVKDSLLEVVDYFG